MIKEWFAHTTVPVRIALGVVMVGSLLVLTLTYGVARAPEAYPLAQGESISSWNFKGAYQDGGIHEKEARDEIDRLKGLVDKGENRYELLVAISSQQLLLGDGKSAFLYLSKAIELEPKKGLAYFNMGHLLEQLGALESARAAYTKAVAVEPTASEYRSYLTVFTSRHPAPQK